jgi:hypothetical protein
MTTNSDNGIDPILNWARGFIFSPFPLFDYCFPNHTSVGSLVFVCLIRDFFHCHKRKRGTKVIICLFGPASDCAKILCV